VELLIVLAIILILMTLGFMVIQRVMLQLNDAKTSREIKQLDQACEQFKSTFGLYPPGRIMLCEDMRGYRAAMIDKLCQEHPQTDPNHQRALEYLAAMSMEYLQAIFPGIDLNAGHDWNGDGVIDDRQYFLTGNESLAFFLGGMRYGKGAVDEAGSNRSPAQGFNVDKTNPTKRSTATRLGPFFAFEEHRLRYQVSIPNQVKPILGPYVECVDPLTEEIIRPGGTDTPGQFWNVGCSSGLMGRPGEQFISFFPRYVDIWNTPFAYFRARAGSVNNYVYLYSPWCYQMGFATTYQANFHSWFADNFFLPHLYKETLTCEPRPSPSQGERSNPEDGTYSSRWILAVPYIQTQQNDQVVYYQAQRFQIISAGPDKQFGTGGFYINDPEKAELSVFKNYKYFVVENIPKSSEHVANFDNITNINFARLVPRP
jgi:type II secretory pathway pseudopilin PulG